MNAAEAAEAVVPIKQNVLAELGVMYSSFASFDADDSGEIDLLEFTAAVKHFKHNLSDKEIKKEFSSIITSAHEAKSGRHQVSSAGQRRKVDYTADRISRMDFIKFNLLERVKKHRYRTRLYNEAKFIHDEWISSNADNQVNIIGEIQNAIEKSVAKGAVHCKLYEAAENEIFALMAADSFARFKQSVLFQQFLESSQSYKLPSESKEQPASPKNRKTKALRSHSVANLPAAAQGVLSRMGNQ